MNDQILNVECGHCAEMRAELAELRAYKERTEAALRKLTLMPGKRRWVEESLKALGLWRDKEPKP